MFKKELYSPLYFLSALGAGGLSVSFFMYLMFIIPRDTSEFVIPTFSSLLGVFNAGNIYFQIVIIFAVLGILFFAFSHLKLLFWNLKKFNEYKKIDGYKDIINTTNEATLMTLPLTFAMTVNVMFILGAVFVPGLWSIVEYLFPFALLAFFLIGLYALKIFTNYFLKIITNKLKNNILENNSLNQLIVVFAFVMIGVGFSASAAMSTTKITIGLGIIFSSLFSILAFIFGILFLIVGFLAIAKKGFDKILSPSIWIIIPILTIVGITIIRQFHGVHYFGLEIPSAIYLIFTTIIITIQLFFAYIGYKLMKENNYFDEYIRGKEKSAGAFTLICPGVALVVFLFFFIHTGLVSSGIIEKFSILYYILLIPAFLIQFKTILVMLKLNKKLIN